MSYVVIARRFRPNTFAEVVGQEVVTRTLTNALSLGRVAHAYLFSGTRGVGKTTTARLLAKCLNCEKGVTAEPCNACASCTEVGTGSSLDVLEIDGASNRGINEIRELRESARYAPARDRHKVFIVDEVHMLTPEAWNALLKTLEEPPRHVVFILATTERDKVPPTILSRCQKLDFRKLGTDEIGAALESTCKAMSVAIEPGALALLARAADGSVRDSQSLLEQVMAYSGNEISAGDVSAVLGNVPREIMRDAMEAILKGEPAGALAVVERLYQTGQDARLFTTSLLDQFRSLLLLAAGGSTPHLTDEERAELARLAEGRSLVELLRSAEVLAKLDRELRLASMPRFALEVGLLELCEMRSLVPIDALIAGLEGQGGPSAPPGGSAPPRGRGAPRSNPFSVAPASPRDEAPPVAPSSAPARRSPAAPDVAGPEGAFLEDARAELGLRAGFLDQVTEVRSSGEGVVELHVAGGPAARILATPDVASLLERVARRHLGETTTIKVVASGAVEGAPRPPAAAPGPAAPGPAAPGPAAPGPSEPRPAPSFAPSPRAEPSKGSAPRARRNVVELDATAVDGSPLVRKLLDIFQGDVSSVTSSEVPGKQS